MVELWRIYNKMALDLNTLKNNLNDLINRINNLESSAIHIDGYLTSLDINEMAYSTNETIKNLDVDTIIVNENIYINDNSVDNRSIKINKHDLVFDNTLVYDNKKLKFDNDMLLPKFKDYSGDLVNGEYYIVIQNKPYLINYRGKNFTCDDFKIENNKIICDKQYTIRKRGNANDSNIK